MVYFLRMRAFSLKLAAPPRKIGSKPPPTNLKLGEPHPLSSLAIEEHHWTVKFNFYQQTEMHDVVPSKFSFNAYGSPAGLIDNLKDRKALN